MKDIDYLPDEMDALASKLGYNGVHPQFADGLVVGWRAACEAMHKKALPQPAADWRAACVVEKAKDGLWDVHSASGKFWLADAWYQYESGTYPRGYHGVFDDEESARAALAACPTPPPDWRQP